MKNFTPAICHNFTKAAPTYDQVAFHQRRIGDHLLQRLLPIHKTPSRITDLGTGTGYMAEQLIKYFPEAHYTLNDLSSGMLNSCKKKFRRAPAMTFLEGPMEHIQLPFQDLIVSNLALQWSDSLFQTLSKFQSKTSLFGFTALLQGTFKEWQDLLPTDHVSFVKNYPIYEELVQQCQTLRGEGFFDCWEESFSLSFDNALQFMHYLRKLGAQTNVEPLPISSLLQALRRAPQPFTTQYKVFFGIFF